MLDDKKDECKGRAGVLACALKGSTEVEISPMVDIIAHKCARSTWRDDSTSV